MWIGIRGFSATGNGHMNKQLADYQDFVEGILFGYLGEILIRDKNLLFILHTMKRRKIRKWKNAPWWVIIIINIFRK